MNRVFRGPAFETNSSSSHSITIGDSDTINDTLPVVNGECIVFPGEFGWEVEYYTNAATKASYCLTYAKASREKEEERLKLLSDVIKKVTGAETVTFQKLDSDSEWYEWGLIDHQSAPGEGDTADPAFESREALTQFIFCKESVLRTGNDNIGYDC